MLIWTENPLMILGVIKRNPTIRSGVAAPTTATVGNQGDIIYDTNNNKWTMIAKVGSNYLWSPDGFPTANAEYISRYDAALGKFVYKALCSGTTPNSTSANQSVTTAISGGVGVEGVSYNGIIRGATGLQYTLPVSLSTTTDAVLADSYIIYTGTNVVIVFKINTLLINKPFLAFIEYTR